MRVPKFSPAQYPACCSVFGSLDQIVFPRPGPNTTYNRRAHLLSWLLLTLIFLTIATLVLVLVVNPPGSPLRSLYLTLVGSLLLLVTLAFGLNRAGNYRLASWITVAAAMTGPWLCVVLDPTIRQGNFAPLSYTGLSILLASLLLPLHATIALAVLQLAGLAILPVWLPVPPAVNWPSLMAFVFFASVLSIIANLITQQDITEILQRSDFLSQREAQLSEQSSHDHLTGLFNRRYLEEILSRELQRATLQQSSLGVIMVDIDRFKALNDTQGHPAGDFLLNAVGKLLQSLVRQSDTACRYGGDEFVLILPEISLEGSRARAENLRQMVQTLELEYMEQPLGKITISVGVAVYPFNGVTSEQLLQAADAALYRAKSAGRDCVVTA